MCDYAHIQEHNTKLIPFGGSQSAQVSLKMVLLKVLLVTFVSCQVVNYGRARSLRPLGLYGRRSYNPFTGASTHWHHRLPQFSFVSYVTTQRPVQLATVNKEYGHKLEKSEIMPNKFFVSVEEASWFASNTICESQGTILASPQNTLQMHKLQAFLEVFDTIPTDGYDELLIEKVKENPPLYAKSLKTYKYIQMKDNIWKEIAAELGANKTAGYWLGGRRKDDIVGNDFYWQFNGKKIDDELWLPSEPNAYEGENCVEFKYSYDAMKLNNFYCGISRRFVCQVVNHDEYMKNDRLHQNLANITQKSHHEIKKISNEGLAGASGKENSPTMTTTTNASTSITSYETNTTATSTATTYYKYYNTSTTSVTTTPTTTTTEEYYSGSRHLSVIEDPFTEYEEYYE